MPHRQNASSGVMRERESNRVGFLGWVEILLDSPFSIYRYPFLDVAAVEAAPETDTVEDVYHEYGEGGEESADSIAAQIATAAKQKVRTAKKGLADWDRAKNKRHTYLLERSAYPHRIILAAYGWLTWGVTEFISALSLIPWVIGSLGFYVLNWISALPLIPVLHTLAEREKVICDTASLLTLPWKNRTPFLGKIIIVPAMLFLYIWLNKWPDEDSGFLAYIWHIFWSLVQTVLLILFFLVNLAEGIFNLGCGLLLFVPKLVHDGLIFLADVFIVGRPRGLKYQTLLSVALLAMTLYFAFFGTAAVLPALLTGAVGFVVGGGLLTYLLPPDFDASSFVSIFNVFLWTLGAAATVLMVCSPQLLLAVPVAMKAALLPSLSPTVFSGLFATSVGVLTAFVSAFVISPLSKCFANCCCLPPRQAEAGEGEEMGLQRAVFPEKAPEPCCPPLASLCARFSELISCCVGAKDATSDAGALSAPGGPPRD